MIDAIIETGAWAERFAPDNWVGVLWIAWTEGVYGYFRSDRENPHDRARFAGYQIGGHMPN